MHARLRLEGERLFRYGMRAADGKDLYGRQDDVGVGSRGSRGASWRLFKVLVVGAVVVLSLVHRCVC